MMTRLFRLLAVLAVPIAMAGGAVAQTEPNEYGAGQDDGPPTLILYSGADYSGEVREIYDPIHALPNLHFNDRARSIAVLSGQWEVCQHSNFTGRCVFLRYDVPDLAWYGLAGEISSVRPVYEYTDAEHGLMFVRDENGNIRYVDDERYGHDTYSYGYGASTSIRVYHYGYSPDYRRYGYYHPRFGYDPYGFGWYGYAQPYYSSTHSRREHRPLRRHGHRWDRHERHERHERRGDRTSGDRSRRDAPQAGFNPGSGDAARRQPPKPGRLPPGIRNMQSQAAAAQPAAPPSREITPQPVRRPGDRVRDRRVDPALSGGRETRRDDRIQRRIRELREPDMARQGLGRGDLSRAVTPRTPEVRSTPVRPAPTRVEPRRDTRPPGMRPIERPVTRAPDVRAPAMPQPVRTPQAAPPPRVSRPVQVAPKPASPPPRAAPKRDTRPPGMRRKGSNKE